MGSSNSKQSSSGRRHGSSFNCMGGGRPHKRAQAPQSSSWFSSPAQPKKSSSWWSSAPKTPNYTKPMSSSWRSVAPRGVPTPPSSTRGQRGSSGGHSWWPSSSGWSSNYGSARSRVDAVRAHQRQRQYMSSSGSSWSHGRSSDFWGGWPTGPGYDPFRSGQKIPDHRRWKNRR